MESASVLNKSAIDVARGYSGKIAWPTIVLCILVFIVYWTLPFLVMLNGLSLFVAIPLMSILTYGGYTVLHDSVHGCISGNIKSSQWLNDGLGYLAATLMLTPLTAHRHEHLRHHRNTNQGADDPDNYSADMVKSPSHLLRSTWAAISVQYSFYMSERWDSAPRRQNIVLILEIAFGILLRALPFVVVYLLGDAEQIARWWKALLLFVAAGFFGTVILVYFFAYIVHHPHQDQDRYLNTSTILIPGPFSYPLTMLWGYQNYHSIHHLFPWVPFYQYRKLFDQVSPIMETMGAPIYQIPWRGLRPISVNGTDKTQ